MRGPHGPATGVAGSIDIEIIGFAGAGNAAASALGAGSLPRVSMEQVFAWNPVWISAIHPDFMTTAKADRLWPAEPAMRAGRVALAPGLPFGRVDFPPAVNPPDGLAVLMTTHHPDHALLVADAAMLLHGGAMIGPMPPAELITPDRLRAAYGVDAVVGALATPQGERLFCAPLVAPPLASPP